MKIRFVFTLLTLLMGVVFANAQQTFNQALSQMKIEQNLGKQVPLDVPFFDSSGKRIKFGELFGKRPLIVLPMFYQCQGICGKETDNLLKTVAKLRELKVGKDYDVVFLSIHPQETPELARNKKTSLLKVFTDESTHDGFHFLVGAPNIDRGTSLTGAQKMESERESLSNIRRVTDVLGFGFAYDEKDGRINHPAGLMILTPAGMISGYIVDAEYPKPVLQEKLVLAESSKIGKKAEVTLLGCIMIDPVTGAKSLIIENVIRLIAGIFAIGLFVWIGIMTVKNRREPILPGSGPRSGGTPTHV